MLGGGMRQAGVLAAAGLIALERGPKRLHIDHANAKFLAERLSEIPGIRINPAKVQTNIVIYDVQQAGFSSSDFLAELARRKVLGVPVDAEKIRMVTHLDVSRNDIEKAVDTIGEVAEKSSLTHGQSTRQPPHSRFA